MQKAVQRRPEARSGAEKSTHKPATAAGPGNAALAAEVAAKGTEGSGSEFPFLDQIQEAFGAHDIGGAVAHTDGEAQEAASELDAKAFAFGEHVAFNGSPDLFTAAHEAAHVVAQRAGKAPSGGVGQEGDAFEQHADAVARRVVAGESAEDLLDEVATPGAEGGGVEAVQFRTDHLPRKEVGSNVMTRLKHAEAGINHTKGVLEFGGGNQYADLKATNFNSYFRMAAMRDPDCWILSPSVWSLAQQYPDALTAAKADLAQGGNCGENAMIAFDWLRVNASSEIVNRCDKEGLDHAFVIMGDVEEESDDELVVCDPWPTQPVACLWEDFFGYTADRSQLNTRASASGDDRDVKAAIAAGLRLSPKGQQMIEHAFDEERTKEEIENGTTGENTWIWNQVATTRRGRNFHYFAIEQEPPDEDAPVVDEEVLEDAPALELEEGDTVVVVDEDVSVDEEAAHEEDGPEVEVEEDTPAVVVADDTVVEAEEASDVEEDTPAAAVEEDEIVSVVEEEAPSADTATQQPEESGWSRFVRWLRTFL